MQSSCSTPLRKSAGAWWQRHVDSETAPLLIWWPADAPFVYSSRSSVREGLAASCRRRRRLVVDELRQRLASAEDEARVAAEQAGQRVAQEPGHGDLAELEEELAVAAGGAAVGNEFSEADVSGGVTSTLGSQSEGEAKTDVAPAGAQAEQDQDSSSASSRSVDELFAQIRASRAAEEAAALAASAPPTPMSLPSGGDDQRGAGYACRRSRARACSAGLPRPVMATSALRWLLTRRMRQSRL